MTCFSIIRGAGLAIALGVWGQAGWAETRALLVGVSDYQYLDADLRGPANDVRLMARTLLARGVAPEAMTVLASDARGLPDGVSHGLPERAVILSGLIRLAAQSRAGDTVLFYFSGHGAQAPDLDGDEAGGYDEILLPADAKGWSGLTGHVENALVDDELRAALQTILDTGAQVVGVIDACHAATGFRALGGQGVPRVISASALNIPQDTVPAAAQAGAAGPGLQGDFVFFYSSQSDQRSFEFPLGAAEDSGNWYGDFTVNFSRALAEGSGSYAQLLRATIDAMQGGHNGAAQTPDAEGPLLAAPVFGGATSGQRIGLRGATLEAGVLQDVRPGALVSVYAGALDKTPLGQAEVVSATPTSATLAADFALPAHGYAAIHRPAPPSPLRLSRPITSDGDYGHVLATFDQVGLDGVQIVETGFDVGLLLRDGMLYATGSDGMVHAGTPRMEVRGEITDRLPRFLSQLVRLRHLQAGLTLAERAAQGSFAFGGGALQVEMILKEGTPRGSRCSGRARGTARPLRQDAQVGHCSEIWLKFANASATAQDVTVLYVDGELGIQALWPRGDLSNRVGFGERREISFRIEAGAAPAPEEIIVLSVPAQDGAPRTVLTALADSGRGRGVPQGALAEYLAAAAEPGTNTRNFSFTGATDPLRVVRKRFLVTPIEQK